MCKMTPGSDLYTPCLNTDWCHKDPKVEHYVDWDNSLSLHNWVQTLDLDCVQNWEY